MRVPFFPDLELARPEWLAALLLLPLLAWWRRGHGRAPAVAFPMTALLRDLGHRGPRATGGGWAFGLVLAAAASAILALARPQWITSIDESKSEGIAICLTVDVSLSMLIEDFYIGGIKVNRLTAAKRVMRDFIEERKDDRVGIVAFAGAPYTPCPLTLDHDWLIANIERVQTGVMEDGTAIGSGIAAAARRLDQQDVPSKVIILLTDGANNSGKLSPEDAARLAASVKCKIYTIAIGTPGVHMIPLPNGRIITSGRQEFDEATLREVANIGNGHFYMAQNTDTLEDIFDTIDQLEKVDITRRSYLEVTELFFWPTTLAALLLALALLLRLTLLRSAPGALPAT
ncbi:MAG: VWA domain-containing protein [Verrucomicrobiales bacterium]|nr:VWA domain-containing protein [Verrucomicrobiales bacterium]